MLKKLSGIILFFIATSAHAQTDAILWKISGNGLDKPSYLFGTIHAYCGRDKIVKPELMQALQSTEVVAMELNLNDFSTFAALMKMSMRKANKSLSSQLSPSEYRTVDSACIAILEDSLAVFNDLDAMALLSKLFISKAIIGCKPIPVDFLISDLAKRENKTSYGLESVGFQDSILRSIPDSIQIKWLLDFCRDIEKSKKELTALLDAYDKQVSTEIYRLALETSPEMAYLKDQLLDARNLSWTAYLKSNMAVNPIFMAVGAGHLNGEKGLITLLKAAGYTLTPIVLSN